MKPFILTALCFLALQSIAFAQLTGNDWCQSPNQTKQSVPISLSATGEHLLVDAVAGQSIQVCGFLMDLGGTTPTAEFDYGTKVSTDCDTAATALTGAMAASKSPGGPLDIFTVPLSKQLCLKLAGTNPTAVGLLTYVQK